MASPHSIQWSAILQKRTGGCGLLRFFNIITINDHESGMKFDFVCVFSLARWTIVTEMSASRSAAGVTLFEGRIYVSGGHDGLQIFNTVSERPGNVL